MSTKVRRQYGVDLQSHLGPDLTHDNKISSPRFALPDKPRHRHHHHTSFAFRDSIASGISKATTSATASTMVLLDTTNGLDRIRRRYADSKHSKQSSATTMNTTTTSAPLTDFALGNHELAYETTPTTGMTSFLPTLHSTPPMPTFQKPDKHFHGSPTPAPNINHRVVTHIDNNGKNTGDNAPSLLNFDPNMSTNNKQGRPTDSSPPVYLRRRNNNNGNNAENAPPARIYIPHRSPETVDGYTPSSASGGASGQRVFFLRHAKAYSTSHKDDRVLDTPPPLPSGWNEEIDRLICKIDALGYDHVRIVQKVRQMHPKLCGQILTPSMIDIRLRVLDQNIEIDYWRAGLHAKDASDARAQEQARDLQDKKFAREGTRANAVRSPPTALRQQEGEQRHQNWSSQYGTTSRHGDGAQSPGLRGGGGDSRTVTTDFMTGYRSRNE